MVKNGLSKKDYWLKRSFDFSMSLLGLIIFSWLILIAILIAAFDTGMSGIFKQKRIGMGGKEFNIFKIRTMRNVDNVHTTVTQSGDPRITTIGRFLRKTKIDELPQLWNVLKGDMSFVGPRPDVPGFADQLKGDERIILSVRPGITGPATLEFRNEEEILAKQEDPEKYNRDIIFPKKIKINMDYINHYSFKKDLQYIIKTILG